MQLLGWEVRCQENVSEISGGELGRGMKSLACVSNVVGYAVSEVFVPQG